MSLVVLREVLWAVALGVLAAASVVDLRRRIIPNEAVAIVALCGVALAFASRPQTVWISLGLGLGVLVALGLVARLTQFGGGDIKMIAAVSLLVPPERLTGLLLVITVAGGLLSVIYLVLRRMLRAGPRARLTDGDNSFRRFLAVERARIMASPTVPYALAILAGVVAYVLSEYPQCSSETHCLL